MLSTAQPPAGTVARWRWLLARWPTAAALAFGLVNWGIGTATAAELLPLLPLVYLAMTMVQRRRLTWVVLVGCYVAVVLLNLQTVVDPTVAVTILAGVLAVAGLVRTPPGGRLRTGLQSLAFAALAVVTVVGLATDPGPGRYLIAAGWLLHAGWDLIHHRRDQVVSRSYAEWCGVFDLVIAASLIASAILES